MIGEDCGEGRPVPRRVVSPLRGLFNDGDSHIFDWVLYFEDGDIRYAVVRDSRSVGSILNHHVAGSRAIGGLRYAKNFRYPARDSFMEFFPHHALADV